MKKLPMLTTALAVLTSLLMFLPETVHQLLYFDHQQLAQGQLWRLLTGHWIHADSGHLIWNVLALVVLSAMIERRSRHLLQLSLGIGIVCVDILLVSPFSTLQLYCGLSGVLNTLLGVALYIYWRETGSSLVILAAILCLAKVALEVGAGQSIFTDISWPPFALAHLAGILGAPVVVWCYRDNNKTDSGRCSGRGQEII